jgi:nicotinic acid mononucleotide adenylyltransferase
MKINIEHVPYNKGEDKTKDKIKWYSWDEHCDQCDRVVRVKGKFLSSKKPDENKKDYCLDCMRKILDE